MTWFYNGEEIDTPPEKAFGFVYQITNLLTGQKYIGKKFFTKPKTRQVKGKKKRFTVESDWKEYWGSNKRLIEDIETHGQEHFRREIIYIAYSRGMTNYMEAKYQFQLGVLESDDYYNGIIQIKIGSNSVKGKI